MLNSILIIHSCLPKKVNLRITSDNLGIYSKRFAIDKQGVLLVKNCLIWFRNDLRLTDNQTVNLCLRITTVFFQFILLMNPCLLGL